MTTRTDEDDRERRKPFAVIWTSGLALLLVIGTGIGLVRASTESTNDRVAPSSTAPVYGSR